MQKKPSYKPDIFQLQSIPYLFQEHFENHQRLTSNTLLQLRNQTHKLSNIMAKVYSYWFEKFKVKVQYDENEEEKVIEQLLVNSEVPIMTVEDLEYILNDCKDSEEISNSQWQSMIKGEKEFQSCCIDKIRQEFQASHQIFFTKKDFVNFHVYINNGEYFLKAHLTSFQFEIKPNFGKKVPQRQDIQEFKITNHAVIKRIEQRLKKKLQTLNLGKYDDKQLNKFFTKNEQFYEKPLKQVDEMITELQVYHNFPKLRMKNYVPISFNDYSTGQPIIGDILSSSNKLCMFNHFIGYDSNTITDLHGRHCEQCGHIFKEFKKNFILEYLRDNLFNIGQDPVFYLPEYNRFKIIRKVRKNLEKQMKELSLEDKPRQIEENQIICYNFIHLKVNLKKLTTKNRLKITSMYPQQIISVFYQLNKRQMIIRDPVRTKLCNHYAFTDLRVFYESRKKIKLGYTYKEIYTCPLCKVEVDDTGLLYLNEVCIILKYFSQKVYPIKEAYTAISKTKFLKETAKIVIKNNEKKVIAQYAEEKQNQLSFEEKQIEGYYEKLVDPYVHFSEYRLGLKNEKKQRRNDRFNFGVRYSDDDEEEYDKIKFQEDKFKY